MFEIFGIEPAIRDQPGARDLVVSKAELAFESVSFSYSGFPSEHAVADISFAVSAGRTLGIVGPPGSGKSTIAHLIPRFYNVTGGRITIDGQDTLPPASRRNGHHLVAALEQLKRQHRFNDVGRAGDNDLHRCPFYDVLLFREASRRQGGAAPPMAPDAAARPGHRLGAPSRPFPRGHLHQSTSQTRSSDKSCSMFTGFAT